MKKRTEIGAILKGQVALDTPVTVMGWVRAFRNSQLVQAEEARGVYGQTAEGAKGFKGPYDGDKARAFIVRKLEKKHGVRGPR